MGSGPLYLISMKTFGPHQKQIATTFKNRADAQSLKEGTKKFKEAEVNFYLGACAMLDVLNAKTAKRKGEPHDKTAGSPALIFGIMRGANLTKVFLGLESI